MDHSLLSIWDLLIIGAYLLLMVLVGVYSVRRIQNTGDYYVAGRSFGPLVLMATVCATIIGGSGLMGRAGVAYSSGFKAILTAVPYLLGMFIFSGLSGRISDIGMQYNLTSIPELFEVRFGKRAKLVPFCAHCVCHDGNGGLSGNGHCYHYQNAGRRNRAVLRMGPSSHRLVVYMFAATSACWRGIYRCAAVLC